MSHPGELTLRRYLAEEALEPATVSHLKACNECEVRLGVLRDEQRAFENEIPFERFAAGVERAARQPRAAPVRTVSWQRVVLAVAALAVLVLSARLLTTPEPSSRVKGGNETVEFIVSGANGQRSAAPVENLASGERVRLGVSGHRYVAAVSIDEQGEVSVIYSEALEGTGRVWLPDSIEFTGSGREVVIVVASDAPIDAARLGTQLKERFAASRDLAQLGTLAVDGVQVHRTFVKP